MTLLKEYEFETKPFEHQDVGFKRSRDHQAYALLMEQGTGKSKVLIDTACYLFERARINAVVVLAPKSVCRNWRQIEIPVHAPKRLERHVALWSSTPKKLDREALEKIAKPLPKMKWLIMNSEAVGTDKGRAFLKLFLQRNSCLLAADESTLFKNTKAARTKALLKLAPLALYRRILTGTPVANRPLDVFAQFEFLSPGCLGQNSFFAFKHRYGIIRKMVLPTHSFDAVVGYQRLPELNGLIEKISYRVLKVDCLDLPEKIYQTRYVELNDEQKRIYNSLVDKAMVELEGQVITAPLVITRVLRLRQVLCGILPNAEGDGLLEIEGKDKRLAELLQILDETSDKAIIWNNFVPSIKRLWASVKKEFGEESAGVFYGDVKSEERQALVNSFQDPESKLKYLIMQPRTGGYGLTLTQAKTVIYYDNDWSLEVRQQSEDRAHRIGQKDSVTYIDLVAAGTVDEMIVKSLREKRGLADQVTGDRWREVFKKVENG